MENNTQLSGMLMIILAVMIGVLAILSLIFIILSIKNKRASSGNRNKKEKRRREPVQTAKAPAPKSYTKESIYKFMEFDDIKDNMIIQKGGKRFVMVINCQGINYDLMSGLEKNSVEQGFLQFLNTLRYPIQIYVQTRTVNLGKSIAGYKERIEEIGRKYSNIQGQYNQMVRSGRYTKEELDKEKYELTRQRNLYEYGLDIVNNTERMSLNKNILSKNYYVILSYYPEEATNSDYAKDEVINLAFSELYTRSQTVINALGVCGINSKILDSVDLAELLYTAYNRDESERYDLRRALNSGFEDLYSTAPDVFDKRIKELDKRIEEEGVKKANDTIYEVVEESEKQRRARLKEQQLNDLIDQMATAVIEQNKRSIGEEVSEEAIKKIEDDGKKRKQKEKEEKEKTKEGGEINGKKETKTRRPRTRSI